MIYQLSQPWGTTLEVRVSRVFNQVMLLFRFFTIGFRTISLPGTRWTWLRLRQAKDSIPHGASLLSFNILGANPQCVLPCGIPFFLDEARSASSQEAAGTTDGTAETAAGADGGTMGDDMGWHGNGLGTFPEFCWNLDTSFPILDDYIFEYVQNCWSIPMFNLVYLFVVGLYVSWNVISWVLFGHRRGIIISDVFFFLPESIYRYIIWVCPVLSFTGVYPQNSLLQGITTSRWFVDLELMGGSWVTIKQSVDEETDTLWLWLT